MMSSLRACEVQPPAQGGIQILGAVVGVLVGCAENCGASAVAMLVGVLQFLDKVVVPVGATTGGRAMLGSTMDTCSASSRVAFGRILYFST